MGTCRVRMISMATSSDICDGFARHLARLANNAPMASIVAFGCRAR